ncbi:MAG: UpxY family transcription antiterminator [Bacteroidota bacterium]
MENKEQEPSWHVIYVRHKHEKKVNEALQLCGITSFLPLIKTLVQWKDRKKKVSKPLFPCYVFVKMISKHDKISISQIQGFVKFLRIGDVLAKVKPSEIIAIKQLLKIPGAKDFDVLPMKPNRGDALIVDYGPLKGMRCIVERHLGCDKIFVKIDSLKYNVSASLPSNYFKPASVGS